MKKSLKSVSFWLVILTTVLSIIFAIIYNWAKDCYYSDPFFSKSVYDATHYLEVAFSSLSLFVCYGIIIYSFARYTPDKAKFSFVYLGINVSACWFTEIFQTLISSDFQSTMASQYEFFQRPTTFYLSTICTSIGQILIEQICPAILIAFITYKMTQNGIQKISKFFSWKNPLQRSMIVSTLIIFGINLLILSTLTILPFLMNEGFYITFSAFIDIIILPICEKLIFSLILQYLVYMLMYVVCNKYGETNGLTQKNNK